MPLTQTALALIGLLLAAWTVAAGWAIVAARRRTRLAGASERLANRLARMIDESPALPLLVHADGRIEGSPRLAGWFGLDRMPGYLSELDADPAGLDAADLARLAGEVRATQKTAAEFQLEVTPRGSRRSLAVRGGLAEAGSADGGAVLAWVFDVSDRDAELKRLRSQAQEAQARFAGLVALIEAAPLPMWFRGQDLRLLLVNSAYVAAVGGTDAVAVVGAQSELVEPAEGRSAAEVAGEALARDAPVTRTVTATVAGQRRSLRVSDLPVDGGVAGYAIDIEEVEDQARANRAFREAQRRMLDLLSAGIAQFDGERRLTFANQPFQRLFAVAPAMLAESPLFDRLLETMRDNGRLPDVRDFAEWRRERQGWFSDGEPREEAWLLADGTHLRVIAQPMPDAGLLLVFEDRTEQLNLSAVRDTLLRTRTATFDNLFEALAVFAPDGRLQLWNRRFAGVWGLDPGLLDQHPHVEGLLEQLAEQLRRPAEIALVGAVIRGATLDRSSHGGQLALADGRYLEFAGVPLPDGNGLLTVLDITDSQRAEAALRERNAALVEADAVKARFIDNLAFEFRTPLTSIGGFAELLQTGVAGELSDRGSEYVAAILASVARLGEQIENVLDLAQSEAGTLPFQPDAVELRGLAREVLAQRRDRATHLGVTFDLRGFDPEVPVEGDRRRLARALGQLVDNAVVASPQGGTVVVEVVRRRQGGARVTVRDDGAGMDGATLTRALDGLRVGSDGKTVDRRQGLGLPLARQLIEAHGGRLELRSEPGQGTSALIVLP